MPQIKEPVEVQEFAGQTDKMPRNESKNKISPEN